MKVWCVFRDYGYEGEALVGIFSTEEKANKSAAGYERGEYNVREYDVDDEPGTTSATIPEDK